MNTTSTKRSIATAISLLAIGLLGMFLGARISPSVARAEPKNAVTWEYSELTWHRNLDTNKMRFVLEMPAGIIQGETPQVLCAKLGTRSPSNTTTDVLNFLGSQGWELVSHSQVAPPTSGLRAVDAIWTMKRAR